MTPLPPWVDGLSLFLAALVLAVLVGIVLLRFEANSEPPERERRKRQRRAVKALEPLKPVTRVWPEPSDPRRGHP